MGEREREREGEGERGREGGREGEGEREREREGGRENGESDNLRLIYLPGATVEHSKPHATVQGWGWWLL